MRPIPVINADRVAHALILNHRCKSHLEERLSWGRPPDVVAREAEGLYRAFKLEAFRGLPDPAKVAWIAVALLVRDLLQQRRPEDAL